MRPNFLEGIRFVDLTWAGAGPFGTKLFSDFGAEVIKVESATRPDSVRMGGPFRDGVVGVNRSGYFASRNTGKKSLTLDLKRPEGKEVLFDLIRKSDVMTNNFGPGAMDRLGLSFEAVRAVKPDIIYLSMPMYGESGPRASLLGVGMTISAVTGLMWSTAYGEGDPVGPGTHYPDHAANPYHAAFAVLAALRYRRQTGKGMKIDLSQVESTVNFIGPAVVAFGAEGVEPPQVGNRSTTAAPHGIYPASGEDEWVAVAVETDDQWRNLATAIGRDDLGGNEAYATARQRLAAADELDAILSAWTAKRPAGEAAATLMREGVPAATVASSRHLVERDAQLAAREYWQRVPHPELGESLYSSPPYRIDGERVELARPPLLGEHNRDVMTGILGLDEQRIRELEEGGVLR